MKALLIEGFIEVYKGLGAALRLFWPMVVFLSLLALTGPLQVFGNLKTDPFGSIAIFVLGLSLTIYLFVMVCQGAVGWHRKLLLNEYARWAPLIPNRRSLKYAVPVVAFILLMLVGVILASQMIKPYGLQVMTAAYDELKITGSPTIEQLEALRRALIPLTVISFIATVAAVSAVLWFGQSWLLVFPHISVRNSQSRWGKVNDGVRPYPQLVGALLIVYFLPSFLILIYSVATPVSVQWNPTFQTTWTLVSLASSILSFLWGLSILSIAYRTLVADKVPYERTGDVAPA